MERLIKYKIYIAKGVISLDYKEYINMPNIKNFILILVGCLISSIGINAFIVHANLLSGGVSGIGLLIQYVTGFPAGYTLLVLNIPLLVISYFKIGKKFTYMTIIGTLALSFFLVATSSMKSFIDVSDTLLLCLYGGVLNGLGIGIVFSAHGSTGGLDIVSSLIKKKYEDFNLGTISFSFNLLIVFIGAFIFGTKSALYTLVSMYITSAVIDKVINGFNRKKLIFIITSKEEQVSNAIMKALGRGVTFLYGEGAYTRNQKKILYCAVSMPQLPALKQLVRDIDEGSFISIMDASEVEGRGFNKLFS